MTSHSKAKICTKHCTAVGEFVSLKSIGQQIFVSKYDCPKKGAGGLEHPVGAGKEGRRGRTGREGRKKTQGTYQKDTTGANLKELQIAKTGTN